MATADDDDRAVPPYEGRRDSADVERTGSERDGARVGGATGPVVDDEPKAADPRTTPRGGVASPADEQPAEDEATTESSAPGTGPSHEPGTARGEGGGA